MTLRDKLMNKEFVKFFEILPKKDINQLIPELSELKKQNFFDAISVVDNPRGIVHMSSLTASYLLEREGIEALMHVSCANKNRIEINSQVLGAFASGIHNILFVTGDHAALGDNPEAKVVYDIDSVQAISSAKEISDKSDKSGKLFIGGVANPLSEPVELQIMGVERKISAGAEFIITQPVYAISPLENFVERAKKISMPFHLIAGIMPLKSLKRADFINNKIPGLYVPEEVIERIRESRDPENESIEILKEIYRRIRKIKEISGVNFMFTDADTVREIIE